MVVDEKIELQCIILLYIIEINSLIVFVLYLPVLSETFKILIIIEFKKCGMTCLLHNSYRYSISKYTSLDLSKNHINCSTIGIVVVWVSGATLPLFREQEISPQLNLIIDIEWKK